MSQAACGFARRLTRLDFEGCARLPFEQLPPLTVVVDVSTLGCSTSQGDRGVWAAHGCICCVHLVWDLLFGDVIMVKIPVAHAVFWDLSHRSRTKLRLTTHGYTLVAKGVEAKNVARLLREAEIYSNI